jgi:hypothetical protein
MKKITILISLNTLFFLGLAQTNMRVDYMTIFKKSDWKTNKGWFGDSLVALTPIKKLPDIDRTGLTKKEIERLNVLYIEERQKTWGERIHFDAKGQLKYSYSLWCSTGERLYNIRTFNISGNKISVEYRTYLENDKNVEYKKSYYLIDKCAGDEIILKLTKG